MDISTNSIEKIIQQSQKIFDANLELFKDTYPSAEYNTIYYLVGLDDKNEILILGFSTNYSFNERHPIKQLTYKTYPDDEEEYLENSLMDRDKVDFSIKDAEYFVKTFSKIIREIKSDGVGNSTCSIYLTKKSIIEFEVDEGAK